MKNSFIFISHFTPLSVRHAPHTYTLEHPQCTQANALTHGIITVLTEHVCVF